MSIWVRNKRGRLEIFEIYFGNLFDTPSPSSSIIGDETCNNHEENRRTMYELLHLTQNYVPSCIMFPPTTTKMPSSDEEVLTDPKSSLKKSHF